MALVSGLMAESLLESSSLAQPTSSNSRTGLTAPSMLLPRTSYCPASTSSSRETVRWTESWARLGVYRVALQ